MGSWCECVCAATIAMFLFRRGTRVAPARSGRWSVKVASHTERTAGSVECRDAATHGELIQHTRGRDQRREVILITQQIYMQVTSSCVQAVTISSTLMKLRYLAWVLT